LRRYLKNLHRSVQCYLNNGGIKFLFVKLSVDSLLKVVWLQIKLCYCQPCLTMEKICHFYFIIMYNFYLYNINSSFLVGVLPYSTFPWTQAIYCFVPCKLQLILISRILFFDPKAVSLSLVKYCNFTPWFLELSNFLNQILVSLGDLKKLVFYCIY